MICAVATVLGLALSACAPDGPTPRAVAIDGDTLRLESGGQKVRISNLDAPEIGGARCDAERKRGLEAKHALQDLLDRAQRIDVTVDRARPTDRYGRWLARVSIDGEDIGEALIARDLARPWRGKGSDWCG